jgi:DNA-directed RNA polymerase subunit H (RpoH/RPB5)
MPSIFSSDFRNFIKTSTQHFSVPFFASFSPEGEDEVIHKYEIERERIKKIYKDKDFLDLTIQKLTSQE